jgi:hypothetical protein
MDGSVPPHPSRMMDDGTSLGFLLLLFFFVFFFFFFFAEIEQQQFP